MTPAQPRYHSQPTPGAKSLEPKIAQLAAAMGQPLLPWQRQALRVATELTADGQLKYREVFISVPRQCGKTAMVMKYLALYTIIRKDAKVWYTAQQGQVAREKFMQEYLAPMEKLFGAERVKTMRNAGGTRVIFRASGGQARPMPPTGNYLHSEQSDICVLDEPWSLTPQQGEQLMQALEPTMATRVGKQLSTQKWYVSTKGDANSIWYHQKLAEAIAELGKPGAACVVDYGIGDDVDPSDIPAVIAAHPGVKDGLIKEEVIYNAAKDMKPGEFARAYGNRSTTATNPLFPQGVIDAASTDTPFDTNSPIHIGVAVSYDESVSAVVAAGHIDEVPGWEVIAARPGTSWVVDLVQRVAKRNKIEKIMIDNHGPAASVAEHLAGKVQVEHATADDLIMGTSALLNRLTVTPHMLIRHNPDVTAELLAVKLRALGDRGRLISRRDSAIPIPRVEAGVLALRSLLAAAPAPAPKPEIWSLQYD